MKLIISALIFLSALPAFSEDVSGVLDGNTYCRTVDTGGMFGQPRGEREHCVSFKAGMMRDGANTFFGRPPSRDKYRVVVQTQGKDGSWSDEYTVGVDSLENSAGAVLNLK